MRQDVQNEWDLLHLYTKNQSEIYLNRYLNRLTMQIFCLNCYQNSKTTFFASMF